MPAARDVLVNCPSCARQLEWQHAPFRPFCSERCRLIDLGAWLAEQRALPGEPAAPAATDAGAESPARSP